MRATSWMSWFPERRRRRRRDRDRDRDRDRPGPSVCGAARLGGEQPWALPRDTVCPLWTDPGYSGTLPVPAALRTARAAPRHHLAANLGLGGPAQAARRAVSRTMPVYP